MDDLEAAKRAAGEAAAQLVTDGMTVGLGSGTTARWFIESVGARVAEGLRVDAVATSLASAALAAARGIPLLELDAGGVDLAVDGADTVDPDLRLLKGLGGALVRERIVAAAAQQFVVVADQTKLRPHLSGFVPVELLAFGWHHTMTLLDQTGATFALRLDAAGEPLRSDNGNLIADGEFAPIADPEGLAARLDAIPGVVGHGLFLGMADLVIVAAPDGTVTRLEPAGSRSPSPILSEARDVSIGGGRMAGETLAWRMIKPGWKVLSRDGTEIGTVGRVLADDGADIFHGMALKHGGPLGAGEREVLAAQIERIVEDAIWTTLDPADVDKLPPAR
jgi:ribose 5-phosphate isomerase A